MANRVFFQAAQKRGPSARALAAGERVVRGQTATGCQCGLGAGVATGAGAGYGSGATAHGAGPIKRTADEVGTRVDYPSPSERSMGVVDYVGNPGALRCRKIASTGPHTF